MRSLIVALLVGVSYAANLASVQAVAAEAPAGTVNIAAYQLVDQDQRVGGDRKQVARPTRWIAIVNVAESTVIAKRTESPAGSTGAGTGAPAGSPATSGTIPTLEGPSPVNSGWVKDCPCDPDCNCIDPAICKNGDCKKNFIVLFAAKWCRWCPRMKAIADDLSKEGYIVYVVDYDTHKRVADELNITTLPTTLVFDNGKEAARYIGLVRAEQLKSGVKKRADQKNPGPAPTLYDFK
jgi:thiol-disulfide isomerase/thioredoxin